MIHLAFACIIGSQGQPDIAIESIQEVTEVLGPTGDILVRVVEISHVKVDSGFLNQVHESYRPAFEITIRLNEDAAFITARSKTG